MSKVYPVLILSLRISWDLSHQLAARFLSTCMFLNSCVKCVAHLSFQLRSLNRNDKVFTQLHQELFGDLLQLSISRYSEVSLKLKYNYSF